MVEARSVLLLSIVAVLALIGLLVMAVRQNPVQQWPGQECSDAPVGSSRDCVGAG